MKQDQQPLAGISQCHEVMIQYKRPLFDTLKRISSSETAVTILKEFLGDQSLDYKEFFWVMLLSNANQVLGISTIGVGSTRAVGVNIREILQLALLSNATGVVVAHNHTGGTLHPSEADKECTLKIKGALHLVDITLLDHLILTTEGYYSFSDEKEL
jgi:DNA repair protein RadC